MGCRCSERRTAIVGAVKRPATALTAAKFVGKTSAEDVAAVTAAGTRRVLNYLRQKGVRA